MKFDKPIETDKRAAREGWAPGGYLCTCKFCHITYIGDKRSRTCAPCAYGDGRARLRPLAGHQPVNCSPPPKNPVAPPPSGVNPNAKRMAELESALRDALASFRCTQRPEQYPADDWCNRAISLLEAE